MGETDQHIASQAEQEAENAFWDAIYDREMPPSTGDDEVPLNETADDDTPVAERVQLTGFDERYQAAIAAVADRLAAVEGDLAIAQPKTKEALVWLGRNADVLSYFFGGSAVLVDEDGPFRPHRRGGMYVPPMALESALADRGLLHNTLLTVINDGTLKAAAGDSPELQKALDSIVGIVRGAYIGHLGCQFASTRNPAYAWHAVKLVLDHGIERPQWISEYLGKCADAVYEAGQSRTPASHAFIATTFGFIDPANGNKFIGQLCDVHDDRKRVTAYKLMKPQLDAGVKQEAVKQDVLDRARIPGTTAIKYKDEIVGRIKTDNPYEQET